MNGWQALGFKSYQEYLESDFWKQKRDDILSQVKFCQKCGSKEKLCVHHLSYINVGNERTKDITVLCWDCHKKEHEEEDGTKRVS